MADAPGKNDSTNKRLLPFDQFGKHMAVAILRRGGTVRTDVEVRTTARHIDVVFRPDRKRRAQLQAAGYLQTIANEPITIEFFHQPPNALKLIECAHRHTGEFLQEHRSTLADKQRNGERLGIFPTLWIFSAGRPTNVMKEFGAVATADHPAGCYTLTKNVCAQLLVISELPRNRDTILLRLFGARTTLRFAIEDLFALPSDAWELEVAEPWITSLQSTYNTDPMITPEQRRHLDRTIAKAEKRFADIRRRRLEAERAGAIAGAKAAAKAAAKEAEKAVAKAAAKATELALKKGLKKGLQKGLQKGLEEGRDHGRVDELVRLVAKRLERPLAPLEQTRIRRRVEKRGIDALETAVLAGDLTKLQWWIAPPVRKASIQSKTAKTRQRRSTT